MHLRLSLLTYLSLSALHVNGAATADSVRLRRLSLAVDAVLAALVGS